MMTTPVLGVAACGDSGGSSTEITAGPNTTSATEGTGTGTGTGTSPTTTGEPTTSGATGGVTEAGTGSTGEMSTGATTTTGTTTDATSDTATGPVVTGTSGDTGTGASDDSGGGFQACETDEDCTLADGCCDCEPIGPGEMLPACDIPECLVTTCTAHGLEGAAVECRFGRCTFTKVQCNPLGVTCNTPEPDCPAGQVAGVEDTNDGRCWTGFCVPAEACDWVPDCDYCDEAELVCVGKLQKGPYTVCEPKPVDCGDSDNIDCACGQQICDASPPHTVCHDAADDVSCECPFC